MQRERALMANSTACLLITGNAPGQSQANRANIRIRRRAEFHRATTKNLRLGAELNVNFEPDHRLVFRQNALGERTCGHVLIVVWLVPCMKTPWLHRQTSTEPRP
jgi:hypothetical protein